MTLVLLKVSFLPILLVEEQEQSAAPSKSLEVWLGIGALGRQRQEDFEKCPVG